MTSTFTFFLDDHVIIAHEGIPFPELQNVVGYPLESLHRQEFGEFSLFCSEHFLGISSQEKLWLFSITRNADEIKFLPIQSAFPDTQELQNQFPQIQANPLPLIFLNCDGTFIQLNSAAQSQFAALNSGKGNFVFEFANTKIRRDFHASVFDHYCSGKSFVFRTKLFDQACTLIGSRLWNFNEHSGIIQLEIQVETQPGNSYWASLGEPFEKSRDPFFVFSDEGKLHYVNQAAVNNFLFQHNTIAPPVKVFSDQLALNKTPDQLNWIVEWNGVRFLVNASKLSVGWSLHYVNLSENDLLLPNKSYDHAVLEAIINSSKNSVILLNPERRVTYFNSRAKKDAWRYFEVEIELNQPIPVFENAGFSKTIQTAIDTVFKVKNQLTFELDFETQKSKITWFNFVVYPILAEDGEVNGVCLNISNITRTKLAVEETNRTKLFYETILNNIPADIAVFDAHHNYLFINPEAIRDEKLRKWLIGKNDFDYCSLKNLSSSIAENRHLEFLKALETRKSRDIVDKHVSADGTEKYVLRRFYPFVDNDEVKLVIGYGIDITSIKLAEERSLHSEHKFRSLFDNNPMLLFIVDRQFMIHSTNYEAARHFGLTKEEIIGKSMVSFIDPIHCNEFTEKFAHALDLESGQSHTCYCELVFNRRQVTVEFSATPIQGEGNEKLLMLVGSDHTERIRNEQLLKKSEEFNRELVSKMPIPFAIVNRDKAEFINDACRNLLQIDFHTQADDLQLSNFVLKDDLPLLMQQITKRYMGLLPSPLLIRMLSSTGQLKYVELSGGLMNFQGRNLNFITLIEKTEEVMQLKAREKAELRTRQIIETALDAVITTDANRLVQDWNPKAEVLFGWKKEEAIGRDVLDLVFSPAYRDEMRFQLSKNHDGREFSLVNQQTEMVFQTKAGNSFHAELFAIQLNVEGETLYSAFIRDITERRQTQSALKESENKLSVLVESLPVVPYTAEASGAYRFTYLNHRVSDLLGYDLDTILNTPGFWLSHVFEDDLPLVSKGLLDFEQNRNARIVYRMYNNKRKVIWIQETIRHFYSEKNELALISGVFQDITELKEEEIRRRNVDRTLNDISREEISSTQSLDDFYTMVFSKLNENLGIVGFSVWKKGRSNNHYTCEQAFHVSDLEQKRMLQTTVDDALIEPIFAHFQTFSSNQEFSDVLIKPSIRKIFGENSTCSFIINSIKNNNAEEMFLILQKDEKDFLWQYEHFNLSMSIAELVSLNLEYFQRIETDSKLRKAYRLAKIGAWEIEAESGKVFWSEAMFEFYGLEPNTTEPLKFEQTRPFIHPEDYEAFSRAFHALLENQTSYRIECRHVYSDGRIRYFEKSAMAITSVNGKLLFMGTTLDITEKKLAEREMLIRQRRKQAASIVGSAISQADSLQTLFQQFTEALLQVTGLQHGIILSQLHEGDAYQLHQQFPKEARLTVNEIQQINHDIDSYLMHEELNHVSQYDLLGTRHLIAPIQMPGRGRCYFLFSMKDEEDFQPENLQLLSSLIQLVQSRAERIHAEIQLRELNTELLDTNLQLRQYSYIVSHNLRAPVANILGCINMYNEDDPADERNRELFDGLKISANSVDNILRDLNKILNIRDNITKQFEYTDFSQTLDLVMDSLRDLCIDVDFILNSNFEAVAGMKTFRPYLVSVFQNILSNAIKYKSPQRKLKIQVYSEIENNKISLIFSDNGRGINLEKHGKNLFKLYSRFHNDVPGSGLGLNMVQEQVRVMGGNIQIESREGEGTTFRFTFNSKD